MYVPSIAVLLIAATAAVLGDIPSGYILDVKATCGKALSLGSSLNVNSDMVITAYADCSNGKRTLKSPDGVHYTVEAIYLKRSAKKGNCLFHRRKDSNVYTTTVYVAYGEKGREVQTEPRAYALTCVLDRHGNQKSSAFAIKAGLLPPKELRSDVGKKTTSTIALNVYNVRGQVFTGSIPRGIKVYLGATTNGRNKEAGLRPVTCDAIGTKSGARLPILRSGCSTSDFFGSFTGFTTTSRTVKSPYFEMVQIEDNAAIKFECVFTLCGSSCNGNSCLRERKKRSAEESADDELVSTEDLLLE